jgi:hypothetical protein
MSIPTISIVITTVNENNVVFLISPINKIKPINPTLKQFGFTLCAALTPVQSSLGDILLSFRCLIYYGPMLVS